MKTKHLLFFTALMLAFLPGFTQVTLTFANSGFVPGDIVVQYAADTTGVVPGTTGANHTWSFGSLAIDTTSTTTDYVAPSSTPYASYFPTANVAASSGSNYEYFIINSTGVTVLGSYSSSASMVYSNTEKAWSFPFAYTNSSTDNFACTFISSGITFYRTGTITTTADGWGTLVMPGGSHNTLRLKMVQDIVDSTVSYGNWTYHIETYMWYDGIDKTPLLEISEATENVMASIYYSKTVSVAQSAAGINSYNNGLTALNLFPNPASDNVTLTVASKNAVTAAICILDAEGKTVKQINYELAENGLNQLRLDIAYLAKGMYLVRVATPKGILYKKLIKN
ncbi:MAG: T9SS type A sorting domain-containing protein [Bacteroidales bacterium]|jgi:hypothetical protein